MRASHQVEACERLSAHVAGVGLALPVPSKRLQSSAENTL